jgi:hypothetical protein
MSSTNWYLGKLNKTEYLLLKDQHTIKFTLKTKCFQGIKQYFQTTYLNVLNPDNYIYNLETEIHDYIKHKLPGLELKSNIIFDQKQFVQFKLDKNQIDIAKSNSNSNIIPEINLILDIEVDKIKINEKTKSYQILLKLIKMEII